MKLSSLLQSLVRNWPVKVLSLIIAMFLYYLSGTMGMGERQLLSEAELIIPQRLEIASYVDREVLVTLRGPFDEIYMVQPDQLRITADFSHAQGPGTYTAYMKLRDVHMLQHISPLEVNFSPKRITVELAEAAGGAM